MQKNVKMANIKNCVTTVVKENLNNIKNLNTKAVSAIVAVMMLVSSFAIITNYYTLAYDVYYGDVNVGVISSKEEAREVYKEADSDVTDCNRRSLIHDLEFVMTITAVSAIENSDIYRGIIAAAEGVEDCYSVNCDSQKVVTLKTKTEAEEAVNAFVTSFGAEGAAVSEYTIDKDKEVITKILSVDDAVEEMKENNIIKVVYQQVFEHEYEIPYKEEVVENSALVEGVKRCVQEGVAGKAVRKSVVVCENGQEKFTVAPMSEIEEEPVTQIVHVGTGKFEGLEKNSLDWPTEGTFTSKFGHRWGRNHNGIDIGAPTGTPIYAPAGGVVTFSGTRNGYGNYIVIDHGNGYETTYAHMNARYVQEGAKVSAGDHIGDVGTTGNVTGPHLHFEILVNGSFTDPMNYIVG